MHSDRILTHTLPEGGGHIAAQSVVEVANLEGHTGPIHDIVELSQSRIVSASGDGTLKTWSLQSRSLVRTLEGHDSSVRSVVPNARNASSSNVVLSASDDGTIRSWNVVLASSQVLLSREDVYFRTLVTSYGQKVVVGTSTGDVLIHTPSTNNGTEPATTTLVGHTRRIFSSVLLLDGRVATASSDDTVKIWDIRASICSLTLSGHANSIYDLAEISEERLVTVSADRTARVWSLETGDCIIVLWHRGPVTSVASEPTATIFITAVSNGYLNLWSAASLTLLRRFDTSADYIVNCMLFLEDATIAAGCNDGMIRIWNIGITSQPLDPQTAQVRPLYPRYTDILQPTLILRSDVVFCEPLLDNRLGEGGFGFVQKARYRDQDVAVKNFTQAIAMAADIRREIAIMQRLEHPHLVHLYGVVESEGTRGPMLVMEYCAERSLSDLHSGTYQPEFPWNIRLRIAREVTLAVKYLHEQRIIHADIKSMNVLLTTDYHVRLADFGLSNMRVFPHTAQDEPLINQESLGRSLPWTAPEQLIPASSRPTRASDIWALGMLFFEIMSRQIPFVTACTTKEALRNAIPQGVDPLITIAMENAAPPGFPGLIRQCCHLNRDDRLSAQQVADILSALIV